MERLQALRSSQYFADLLTGTFFAMSEVADNLAYWFIPGQSATDSLKSFS
jgi:hypothetical protein